MEGCFVRFGLGKLIRMNGWLKIDWPSGMMGVLS